MKGFARSAVWGWFVATCCVVAYAWCGLQTWGALEREGVGCVFEDPSDQGLSLGTDAVYDYTIHARVRWRWDGKTYRSQSDHRVGRVAMGKGEEAQARARVRELVETRFAHGTEHMCWINPKDPAQIWVAPLSWRWLWVVVLVGPALLASWVAATWTLVWAHRRVLWFPSGTVVEKRVRRLGRVAVREDHDPKRGVRTFSWLGRFSWWSVLYIPLLWLVFVVMGVHWFYPIGEEVSYIHDIYIEASPKARGSVAWVWAQCVLSSMFALLWMAIATRSTLSRLVWVEVLIDPQRNVAVFTERVCCVWERRVRMRLDTVRLVAFSREEDDSEGSPTTYWNVNVSGDAVAVNLCGWCWGWLRRMRPARGRAVCAITERVGSQARNSDAKRLWASIFEER